jgi:enoyl-CoA hydratase/carnithine racemase
MNVAPKPVAGAPLAWYHGETMTLSDDGGVWTLALHRAPHNEIGEETIADLEQVLNIIEADYGRGRGLVIYSERPGSFSAGADLRALHEGLKDRDQALAGRKAQVNAWIGPRLGAIVGDALDAGERAGTRLAIRQFLRRLHKAFDRLEALPIPTVAATHGIVFGGGFELALCADLIVADQSTRFAFPELRLGLVPGFGGIPRLAQRVGQAAVSDLVLTGRSIHAERALALGLVSQVVPRGEALRAARSVAAQWLRFEPDVVAAAKAFIKKRPAEGLKEERRWFLELAGRPATREGLRRFATNTTVRPYLP